VSAELPGGVEVGGSLRQTQGAGPQDPLPAVLGQWQALRAKNEGGQKETRRGGARRAVRGRSQARRGCPQKRRQLGTRGAEKTHPDMPLVRKNVVPGGPLLVVGRWAGDRRRRGGGRRGGGARGRAAGLLEPPASRAAAAGCGAGCCYYCQQPPAASNRSHQQAAGTMSLHDITYHVARST
jgi:hypothetical protein